MYAFHGYGTNEYASRRPLVSNIVGPIVKLAMRVLLSTYGVANGLMLRFRNTTLSNPQSNNTTLEL
jgi:hypothetical protein